MTAWHNLGSYLGRTIQLTQIREAGEIHAESLHEATVLIVFESTYDGSDASRAVIQGALRSAPVAVAVSGAGAAKAFDDLIDLVSASNSPDHIMTAVFDEPKIDDVVSNFLFSTWPAEERFHTWRKNVFLLVGDGKIFDQISRAIRTVADSEEK